MSPDRIVQSRRKFLKLALGFGVVSTGGLAVADKILPKPDFETQPKDIRDNTLWRVLRPMMETLGDGKKSNFWQWHLENLPEGFKGTKLAGDPEAFVRISMFDRIRMSLGGWNTAYELRPQDDAPWQIGYKGLNGGNQIEIWSGVIKGAVRFLRGNGDFIVYGINRLTGEEVPLTVIDLKSRKDNPDGVPLVQIGNLTRTA